MLARSTDQQIMDRLGFMKPDPNTKSLPKPTLWSRFGVASQFSVILESRWMEARPVLHFNNPGYIRTDDVASSMTSRDFIGDQRDSL